MRLPI